MVKNHYPGYEAHKKAHDDLKTTLGHLEEDFVEEGPTEDLAGSINVFLVNWLIKHIHAIDTKFGKGRSFFSGEGLFLLKLTGPGTVLLSSYGMP